LLIKPCSDTTTTIFATVTAAETNTQTGLTTATAIATSTATVTSSLTLTQISTLTQLSTLTTTSSTTLITTRTYDPTRLSTCSAINDFCSPTADTCACYGVAEGGGVCLINGSVLGSACSSSCDCLQGQRCAEGYCSVDADVATCENLGSVKRMFEGRGFLEERRVGGEGGETSNVYFKRRTSVGMLGYDTCLYTSLRGALRCRVVVTRPRTRWSTSNLISKNADVGLKL
jgi:hypothetical protein